MEKTEINGKIYTIRSPHTEKFYIGSTIQKYLSDRMYTHRKNNTSSSSEIIKLGDAYIELIENYKCNTKEELRKREGELIRLNKDNCVNKQIAGRSNKQWREENKEYIKQYKLDNEEKIKQYTKEYCKKYFQENKLKKLQ
jgi:hypothetical protein